MATCESTLLQKFDENNLSLKHGWLMDIRHFLFGHQILWGKWIETKDSDGCSLHAKCRYCGYEGMIDSQGNLF